jgi:hypothetical protein
MKVQTAFEFLAVLSIVGFLILSSFYLTRSSIESFKIIGTNFTKVNLIQNSPKYFNFSFQISNTSTFQKSLAYAYIFSTQPVNVSLTISSDKYLNLSYQSNFEVLGSKMIPIVYTPIYPGMYDVLIKINNQTMIKKVKVNQNYKLDVADFSNGFGNGITANLLLFSNKIFIPILELQIANQKITFQNVSFSGIYNIKKDFYFPMGIYNLSLRAFLFNGSKIFEYSSLVSTSNSTSVFFAQDSQTIFNFSKPLQIYKAYYTRQCTVYVNGVPWAKCDKNVKWSYTIFSEECYTRGYGIDYLYCIYLLPVANEYNLTSKNFNFSLNISVLTKDTLYNINFPNTNKTKVLQNGKEVGNASIKEISSNLNVNAIILDNFSSKKLVQKDNLILYQSALQNLKVIGDSINGKRISSDYEIKNAINIFNNASQNLLFSRPIQTICDISSNQLRCKEDLYFKVTASINSLPQMQFLLRNLELYIN